MSGSITLRCRTPGGQQTLSLGGDVTVGTLRQSIADQCGVPVERQRIKLGFPPRALAVPDADALSLHLRNGDSLIVEDVPAADATSASVSASASTSTPTASSSAAVSSATSPPTSARLSTGSGQIVRRVVAADNSCLFNSIAYVLESRAKDKAEDLRIAVACAVASDPDSYSEAFLAKPNAEYVDWILQKDNWGGAIECSVLSKYYQTEVAVVDTQTLKCYVYGEDSDYTQRVYLIFDGIHYDPLALTPAEGYSPHLDLTIFNPRDDVIQKKATALAEEAKRKHNFVDVAKFDLRCLVCQVGLVGQKGAQEHAMKTGHSNFAEFQR